jgi:hypothetical protein
MPILLALALGDDEDNLEFLIEEGEMEVEVEKVMKLAKKAGKMPQEEAEQHAGDEPFLVVEGYVWDDKSWIVIAYWADQDPSGYLISE